jgi:predicted nucleic acid-binding protein
LTQTVVVDVSVAVAWLLPEGHTNAALRMAETWLGDGIHIVAPGLFSAEITNALHQRVRRGEIGVDTAVKGLRTLAEFEIELRENPDGPIRALELATQHARPSTYDCYYLALAEALDCECWTADERFYNSVRATEKRVRFIGGW